jgi:ribosome recycling factor
VRACGRAPSSARVTVKRWSHRAPHEVGLPTLLYFAAFRTAYGAAMLANIKQDAQQRMAKSVDALKHELQRLRTGRASPALVEHLKVNYYGSDMPLSQVANIAVTDGRSLTITLTAERRKELAKHVAHEGENAKVAIRNIRRDAMHHVKELLKEKQITEDEERRAETDVQNLTDKFVKDVDGVVKAKEDELMAL